MKKFFVMLALAMPMLVSAQKFGHINTQELFAAMPEVAVVRQQMDTIQSQYESQLAMMQEEFQKKYQEYQQGQATMADGIRQYREQELAEMQQRIQTFYQTAEQDIQKKQQELLAPVHEKMANAIKSVGEKEGFTYIFDSQAAFFISETANDVMDSVKKELKIK